MQRDPLDIRLQSIFDRARQPMPAQLEAQLLDIPARQSALSARWLRRLMPLAAALSLSIIALTFGRQAGAFLAHLLGGRIAGAFSEGTYRLYSLVMEQWAPWQETLPLAFAAPISIMLGVTILAALWLSYRPVVSRMPVLAASS